MGTAAYAGDGRDSVGVRCSDRGLGVGLRVREARGVRGEFGALQFAREQTQCARMFGASRGDEAGAQTIHKAREKEGGILIIHTVKM